MVVWATSANNPGSYYDNEGVADDGDCRAVEQLAGKQLAEMASVNYTARDGLEIPAYLTLPAGRATQRSCRSS